LNHPAGGSFHLSLVARIVGREDNDPPERSSGHPPIETDRIREEGL